MRAEDGPAVQALLEEYLKRFQLRPKFSEQEVLHWLLPREEVIDTYVVEVCVPKQLSDLCSCGSSGGPRSGTVYPGRTHTYREQMYICSTP